MSSRVRTSVMMTIAAVSLISLLAISPSQHSPSTSTVSGQPLRIPQGPMGVSNALTSDPYWFQQGAQGRTTPACETCDSFAARVTISTVSDNVNNDAHSYWVGSILANDAFVQVGYLNGLTTTNQYYCCAWFYEYFPAGNTNSPPIIGPPGSAGPIGSWHTYSMNYTGNGEWSFYMDDQYLGSSPAAGQQYYLGSGDDNSGNHAVAALSEVAQTTVNTDIIGPAEFIKFQYQNAGTTGWTDVPNAVVHWGYGATSSTNLPNPYNAVEIVGVPNDFLTGSAIPYHGTTEAGVDMCGNSIPTPVPTGGGTLWPLACPGGTTNSFSFVDENGTAITPTWISLSDSTGRQIFYSDYQNYGGLTVPTPTGKWTVNQVSWRAVNVAAGQTVNTSLPTQIFSTHVFTITLAVVGYFYQLPVKNATVIMYLPDSTNQTLQSDNSGKGVFTQLPPANYSLHITVPYGIASNQVLDIAGPGSVVAKVFSLPELITIVVPPILITILVAIVVVRKERQRQAMIQAQAPLQQPMMGPVFCRTCGQQLVPTANFCTRCGTPVRMMVQ